MSGLLFRIVAPHFVAGLILARTGRITQAAPILRYMVGWSLGRVESYCLSKGWAVNLLSDAPPKATH